MLPVSVLLAALMATADAAGGAPAPPAANAPAVSLGSFNNFQFSGNQQRGYGIDLWRVGGVLSGVFIMAEGLQGQTPCGPLKVMSGPTSAELSFTAVIPTGRHSCPTHNDVIAHDTVAFLGRLTDKEVTGTLRRQEMLHPEVKGFEGAIKLKRDKDVTLPTYPDRTAWERAELARCPQQ